MFSSLASHHSEVSVQCPWLPLLSMTVPFANICILGETDQETLRNITSATLDFPAELFEGVSEEAKEFIKECLNRNPK